MQLLHDFLRLRLAAGFSRRRREAMHRVRVVTVPAPLAAHRPANAALPPRKPAGGESPVAGAGGGQPAA